MACHAIALFKLYVPSNKSGMTKEYLMAPLVCLGLLIATAKRSEIEDRDGVLGRGAVRTSRLN
jgi:hypothetical protein